MWTPLKEAKSALVNKLVRPKRLMDVVSAHPELIFDLESQGSSSIALGQVVHWERFAKLLVDGRRGYTLNNGQAYLSGLAHKNGQYQFAPLTLPAVSGDGEWTRVEQDWQCDIRQVQGLSASKSDLTKFKTLDQFVRQQSPEMITEISQEGLRRNLAHREIRILDQNSNADFFVRHTWDGRVFLANSGGSHHFAAARLIAGELNIKVPLAGRLYTRYLDERVIYSLIADFDIFTVRTKTLHTSGFSQALEDFKVTYAFSDMPLPFNRYAPNGQQASVLWLPKNNDRSRIVANELRQAGFFDLNSHFVGLLRRQSMLLKQWEQPWTEQINEPWQQEYEDEPGLSHQAVRPRI